MLCVFFGIYDILHNLKNVYKGKDEVMGFFYEDPWVGFLFSALRCCLPVRAEPVPGHAGLGAELQPQLLTVE